MSEAKHPSVLLLSMPWTAITEPSLGLAILKAQLKSENITCTVSHLNLFLLKYMRASTYFGITNMYALNEFFFTRIFEETLAPVQLSELSTRVDDQLVYKHFGPDERYNTRETVAELFLRIRNEIIPEFLKDCLAVVANSDATMVGFTCMFDQTIASLALAKLVHKEFPDKMLVFGGYALEGPPGEQIIRSFDFVDCVAFGEGENVIGKLAQASVDPSLLKEIPNLLYRERSSGIIKKTTLPRARIKLDESPEPDFDDFFIDLEKLNTEEQIKIKWKMLPIETSRGCWWGQTNHCVFCGIDDETMKYRQRSMDNTLRLLNNLREKYSTKYFRISDYILPYKYYKTLLPELAALPEEEKFILTCELKSNISFDNFKLLRDAGFVEVQPGIESFSSKVLKKMDKGVTGIQNVFCLVLGLRFGIRVNYNFLFGFPDDDPEDYEKMLSIIPQLYHLNPPSSRVEVAITRFAPLQTDPKRFSIRPALKPNPGYDVIFSPEFLASHDFQMSNYCYYFEPTYEISDLLKNLYRLLAFQIDNWRNLHSTRRVVLSFKLTEKEIIFTDSRFDKEPNELRFDRKYAEVYLPCTDKLMTIAELMKSVARTSPEIDTETILDRLVSERLVFREGNKVLALAVAEQEVLAQIEDSTHWSQQYI
jgi:ribosomal peptide maturation radical SAM protein 1